MPDLYLTITNNRLCPEEKFNIKIEREKSNSCVLQDDNNMKK